MAELHPTKRRRLNHSRTALDQDSVVPRRGATNAEATLSTHGKGSSSCSGSKDVSDDSEDSLLDDDSDDDEVEVSSSSEGSSGDSSDEESSSSNERIELSSEEQIMNPTAVDGSTGPAGRPMAIKARLAAFLPLIRAANEDLERAAREGRLHDRVLDAAGDDEAHIEMDLGLGVLEERRQDHGSGVSESTDSGEEVEDGQGDGEGEPPGLLDIRKAEEGKGKVTSLDDARERTLRKMLARPEKKRKPGIEVLSEDG